MDAAEKHLAAYDRVMKVLETNNDHYFKRTQILMIVMQSALLLSMGKFLGKVSAKYSADMGNMLALLKTFPHTALVGLFIGAILSVLGIIGAYAWIRMITRQHQRMELCRNYLRDLENTMSTKLNIPLNFCQKEQIAFYYNRNIHFDGTNDFPSKGMCNEIEGSVIKVEKHIAKYLMWLWVFIWVAIVVAFSVLAITSGMTWYVKLIGISLVVATSVLPIHFFSYARKERRQIGKCRDCQQICFQALKLKGECNECQKTP